MSDQAKRIGVIGEGRANRKKPEPAATYKSDFGNWYSTDTETTSHTISLLLSPGNSSVHSANSHIDLFSQENKMYKPVARRAPCCGNSPLSFRISTELTAINHFDCQPATFCGQENSSTSRNGEATRGEPDGEPKITDDFKLFISKFNDLKMLREKEQDEKPEQKKVVKPDRDPLESCEINVQQFFMKYATDKTDDC